MEQRKKQRKYDGTIFDDVFRTMAEKMPSLLIPLINEVFHRNYPKNERIELMKNEHMTESGKIISDSHFRIRDSRYHIECQSRPDGTIAIRMLEYDIAIALSHARQVGTNFYVKFPQSCVLYLRHNSNTKETETVTVEFADGTTYVYHVPIIRVQSYSKKEIFAKRLLLFLPYYLMRYEKELSEICSDGDRLQTLLFEFEEIKQQLEAACSEDEGQIYTDLNKLIIKISDYLLRGKPEVRKGVDKIMGGEVLELYSEKLIREGKEEGIKEGIKEGVRALINTCISFGASREITLKRVEDEFKLSKEEAEKMLNLFWK